MFNILKTFLPYLRYVLRHKWYVLVECCKMGVPWRGIVHDWSKFSPAEWRPYALSFYGPWEYEGRPQWLVEAMDRAWLHHQHCNDHHWQHWVLVQDDDPTVALPIPDRVRREMLADWRGANRAQTGGDHLAQWYAGHKDKMQLHPDTREWIEAHL